MSTLLTRLNLSDPENAKDCWREYERIAPLEEQNAARLRWANRWGDAIVVFLRETADREDDLAEAERENSSQKRALDAAHANINSAVTTIKSAIADLAALQTDLENSSSE